MNWCGRSISSERGANCHVNPAGLKTGATGAGANAQRMHRARPRRGTALVVATVTNDHWGSCGDVRVTRLLGEKLWLRGRSGGGTGAGFAWGAAGFADYAEDLHLCQG